MAALESRGPSVGRVLNGQWLVLIRMGQPVAEQLRRARVTCDDVLREARQQHGLSHLAQIRYAILEAGGHLSIIP